MEVTETDRKLLVLALAALVVTIAVSPMASAQITIPEGPVTMEPYSATYTVKMIQNSSLPLNISEYGITTGAVFNGTYEGTLGNGTMTTKMIVMVVNNTSGEAWSAFNNTLEITSGPYGNGTFEGFSWFRYGNITQQPSTSTSGGTLLHGTGALKNVTVTAEKETAIVAPETSSVKEQGYIFIVK